VQADASIIFASLFLRSAACDGVISLLVAHTWASLISERTKAALKAAKARGMRLGPHGREVLAPKFKQEARRRAMELKPLITELKSKFQAVAFRVDLWMLPQSI
jgi:hypothetical protein